MSEPNTPETDEPLEAALRARLEAIRAPLPPAVAGRLRAARRTALAALEERDPLAGPVTARHAGRRRLAALGGAVALASAGWLALRAVDPPAAVPPGGAPPPSLVAIEASDWPLLADAEEVGFYDDIEFWLWLDEDVAEAHEPRG